MGIEPTYSISFDAGTLTDEQRDGTACVACGTDLAVTGLPSVPVGVVKGAMVFACTRHTQDATAGKSSDWPGGEPRGVRTLEEIADDAQWALFEGIKRVERDHGPKASNVALRLIRAVVVDETVPEVEGIALLREVSRGEIDRAAARLDEIAG
ncbi:hypothetical protein [Actinomadura rugatobispora]|uniref:Uncharacterized protein n=1 Tax=Actinomadura rugatobispora TaxID=1994 RepID=A0ABW1AFR9_9ACTN|nr:hypothetical protein GCM10010200_072330 [Actinomadura rugatobispora]